MCERTQESALAIHGEIPRRPNGWSSHVTGENRVLGRNSIEHACHILRMDWLLARTARRHFVQSLARVAIVRKRFLQVLFVLALYQFGEESTKCALCVSDKAEIDLAAA